MGIEETIRDVLSCDTQKNAMDFVSFLRENELPVTANDDGGGWAVGGTVGDSKGYMVINGAADFPGPWTVWLNSCDFDDGALADDELKETAWAHASDCGRCHAGWKDCGGGERTIWGKTFERLCHSPLMFTDPDAKTVGNLEKLLLMLSSR